jgi:hypothetical protein
MLCQKLKAPRESRVTEDQIAAALGLNVQDLDDDVDIIIGLDVVQSNHTRKVPVTLAAKSRHE